MLRVIACHPFPRHLRDLMQGLCLGDDVTVVGGCLSGAEALALVRRHDPDVLVADLWLDDMSGIEAARVLACEGRRTRVVLFAGDLGDPMTMRALQHGIHATDDVITLRDGYRTTYPPMNVDE